MPASVINATINGINATGGNVAELELQVGGTTAITVNSAGYSILSNPLPVASGGTGSNTGAFSGANLTSLNASSITSGTLSAANGGTGSNTLTANNVILGNGTSAVQFVAPGTASNVLTSNGTAWVSQAAGGGGGVTSLNGQTGAVVTTDLDVIGAITVGYYGITNPTTTSGRHSFLSRGATLAGSSIRIGNATTANNSTQSSNGNISFQSISNSTTTFPTTQTTTLSGTWRNIGGTLWSSIFVSGCTTTYQWYPMLWVRIS